LSKRFGGLHAVDDVSFEVPQGKIVALIGPNGAGKTTLFNLVSGRLKADAGDVLYEGKSILGVPAHKICRLGMARTFQITSVFPKLTCLQNVQVALFSIQRRSHWLWRDARKMAVDAARERLNLVGIEALADRPAGLMSYGDQKRLELAMVMALRPKLLLLDEPTAGVDVNTRRALVGLITRLCESEGLSLLFCEHDMEAVFSIAHRITVLHQGRTLIEGTPDAIRADREVRAIYLGAGEPTQP
jgi:branched-chain amino acid transport system ATP-binding protein